MKKILLSLFVILLVFQTSVDAQSYSYSIDSLIQFIDSASYYQHFDSLKTGKGSNRKVVEDHKQTADHDAARDYIFRSLKKYLGDSSVYLHHFESDNYQGLTNVIGIKPGQDIKAGIWIVSAHYDTNNNLERNSDDANISPGANDNGTGVAAMLEMARVCGTIETEATVLFVAWDLEEVFTNGYPTGSNAWYNSHVINLKTTEWDKLPQGGKINKRDIRGNLNFDMFGNPQDSLNGLPLLWVCWARKIHAGFVDQYVETFERYVPEIAAINYGRLILSDHYTFAAAKIPALENLESAYSKDPFYHTHDDHYTNPENINFKFAALVSRGGLAFLLENVLLQVTKKEEH